MTIVREAKSPLKIRGRECSLSVVKEEKYTPKEREERERESCKVVYRGVGGAAVYKGKKNDYSLA